MTEQRREKIDPFYGQPIGSRRLKIAKLHYKLRNRYHALCMSIHKKYESSFRKIKEGRKNLGPEDALKYLAEHKYFELWGKLEDELKTLRESPLGRIVDQELWDVFDRSDHENMLDASGSLFRLDSDPVIEKVLTDDIYKKGLRKRQKDRERIYSGRRMKKATYEKYLSEAVGRPITIEQYEIEIIN